MDGEGKEGIRTIRMMLRKLGFGDIWRGFGLRKLGALKHLQGQTGLKNQKLYFDHVKLEMPV